MLGIGPHGPTGPARARALAEVTPSYPEEAGTSPAAAPPSDGDRDALAVLSSVDGIGPITLERLLAAFDGPAGVLEASKAVNGPEVVRAASRGPGSEAVAMRLATAQALHVAALEPARLLDAMAAAGTHALLLEDEAYPRRLREIALPPRLLFVRGADGALESGNSVAVVGTRRPTDPGRRTAGRIGAALARAGALVVSGLALGIDGATHAAVVGERGRTVAVIGGGHDRLYPRAHDRLGEAIVEAGGAVISEHAPGTRPSKGTFPRRNRVISGLADAVVVVEAGARSGALVTAAWALEQGRECFLVPGSIDDPQSAGCLAWLRDYSGATRIVAGIAQLLEDLGLEALAAFPPRNAPRDPGDSSRAQPAGRAAGPAMRPGRGQPSRPTVAATSLDVPDRERRLLVALDRGASTVDELAATTTLPVAVVLGGLTGLEVRGLVEEVYGRYRIPAGALARAGAMIDPAA